MRAGVGDFYQLAFELLGPMADALVEDARAHAGLDFDIADLTWHEHAEDGTLTYTLMWQDSYLLQMELCPAESSMQCAVEWTRAPH